MLPIYLEESGNEPRGNLDGHPEAFEREVKRVVSGTLIEQRPCYGGETAESSGLLDGKEPGSHIVALEIERVVDIKHDHSHTAKKAASGHRPTSAAWTKTASS